MTTSGGEGGPARKPRVFKLDDPALTVEPVTADTAANAAAASKRTNADAENVQTGTRAERLVHPAGVSQRMSSLADRGLRIGSLLFTAAAAAVALSLALWFWRLVSVGLERDDALGWIMRTLVAAVALAVIILLVREIAGYLRLRRLGALKAEVDRALAKKDIKAERRIVSRLVTLYGDRDELKWSIARMREHQSDVLDPGARLMLLDRTVMNEIDASARQTITRSSKRMATVTALSPLTMLAFAFMIFEVLWLLRRLATLYGGRPGVGGSLRLARTVIGNLIAAGGVALTDDLLGQFIGQDLLRRLSRRLGEAAFNAAIVARIGVAALDTVRPLPFLAGEPVRVRDIVGEVVRGLRGSSTPDTQPTEKKP